jgi:hypothetical protein
MNAIEMNSQLIKAKGHGVTILSDLREIHSLYTGGTVKLTEMQEKSLNILLSEQEDLKNDVSKFLEIMTTSSAATEESK